MNLSDGVVRVTVLLKPEVFYRVLSEQTGLEIGDEAGLMPCIIELPAKREYEKIRSALEQVEATGYGIVMPSIDELHLEPPEIVHQDGRCGVRLQACAPSIQMMKDHHSHGAQPHRGHRKAERGPCPQPAGRL